MSFIFIPPTTAAQSGPANIVGSSLTVSSSVDIYEIPQVTQSVTIATISNPGVSRQIKIVNTSTNNDFPVLLTNTGNISLPRQFAIIPHQGSVDLIYSATVNKWLVVDPILVYHPTTGSVLRGFNPFSFGTINSKTTTIKAANINHYVPFMVREAIVATSFSHVVTAAGDGTARYQFYNDNSINSQALLGSLVLDTGNLNVSSVGSFNVNLVKSGYLLPGSYFMRYTSTAQYTTRALSNRANFLPLRSDTTEISNCYFVDPANDNLTANLNTFSTANLVIPTFVLI